MLTLGLSACSGGDGAPDAAEPVAVPSGALLDPAAWTAADAEDDPFPDRPAEFECGPGGFGPETGVFEVETQICEYLTARQDLTAQLPEGATLTSVVWHLPLTSDEPAEGHVALRLGDHLVFEARVPIPGPEAVYPIEWVLPAAVPAGTPAYFHVHNHGANSWRLGPVEARAP